MFVCFAKGESKCSRCKSRCKQSLNDSKLTVKFFCQFQLWPLPWYLPLYVVPFYLFLVKYLNAVTGIVFLRFPKRCYRLLWSALPFITSIQARGQKIPCFFNCLYVGGTIRTCQKFLIRYNTRQLHRMLPKCKNEEEKHDIRKAILDCCLIRTPREESDDALESEEDEWFPWNLQ